MPASQFFLGLSLLALATALGAESPFVFGPEEVVPKSIKPGEKWKEGAVSLPPWPRDSDLIEISLDQQDDAFSYLIDGANLNTGDDGVVRYTVIAKSGSGARNVTFEGIRCGLRGSYRIYAYGQDGRFELATAGDDWQSIGHAPGDPAREELWRHYLCIPRLTKPRPTRDQRRMLRSGRVPEIEGSSFLSR
jgi:hypothetical protein